MIIIVDSNSVCHRAKHSMGDLSWEDKKVGVIFGFVYQILVLAKKFESNRFVFAWDSSGHSVRRSVFPEYKSGRRKEKTPEEKELDDIAYDQFNIVRNVVLPEIGFVNNFWQDGFEADDIIASIVKSNKEEMVIISSDEDLYQLLSEGVFLYSLKKKQEYTVSNLWKEHHVSPIDWVDVKAIAGCSSDNIPGIQGVAEKTACKYLNRQLPIHLSAYKSIKAGKDIIDRNMKLVTLPFPGTKVFPLDFSKTLSVKGFLSICGRFGFESFTYKDNLSQWKKYVLEKV